jgi:hypothetical protein
MTKKDDSSLIRLIRTFGQYTVQYVSKDGKHFIAVRNQGGEERYECGPIVSHDLPVVCETAGGRRFVGQAYTDRLPRLFEIRYADDERGDR